ncbi:MAG: anti-sigma factor antagonist, partial [Nitrospira sp.]|nr:anti-sigma factor antagonist [Nitrospira sp.]
MTDLRFDITPIDTLANTARVVVEGAIDATTVISFESQLKQLQEDGYTNFVLDMQGIKYVNSTGLGSLVATADNLEKVGGGLALIRVHPKVKVVFDMLGLNSFFRIFTNEEEATGFLASRGGDQVAAAAPAPAPAPAAPARAPAPPPPPPAAPAAPPRAPTGQYAQAPARPPTGQYAAAGAPQGWVAPTRENPQVVTCPNCSASFKVSQPGRYKCPSCTTAFVVDPRFGVELAPATSQLTLSFTPECREGFALYLGAMVRRAGYAEADYGQLRQGLEQIIQGTL